MADGLKGLDYSVVQQCMHCGMCLPDCPTYQATNRERHSPRGRIALMRAVADDALPVDRTFSDEMAYCLGCLACQSACPADVHYAHLFEHARWESEKAVAGNRSPLNRFYRWLTLEFLFTRPHLLRGAGRLLRVIQRSQLDLLARKLHLIPCHLRHLEPQAPRIAPAFSNELIQPVEQATDAPRLTVGLLTGCVQDLAFSGINRDTADVLIENGCRVITPPHQPCCGSLHAHNGELELAREQARNLIDTFSPIEGLDAIITNAGGCGSHLKHFGELLKEDPYYHAIAREWDSKVRDIHEFLSEVGFRQPGRPANGSLRITYHPSCHLHHGQRVKDSPLEILRSLPGVELAPLHDATTCCGSAGIYSITQPDLAGELAEKKVENLVASEAEIVATANPGCHLQIANTLAREGVAMRVAHPVTLLAEAYRRERSD